MFQHSIYYSKINYKYQINYIKFFTIVIMWTINIIYLYSLGTYLGTNLKTYKTDNILIIYDMKSEDKETV